MLSRLMPKNERFFDYFTSAAKTADRIAQAFSELVNNYSDVERKVQAIRDIEHQGDAISQSVTEALTQSFMTPIDREDIVLLSGRLDDFIDAIEEAARRMWLYRIAQPSQHTQQMAQIIVQQAKVLADVMPMLEDLKHGPAMIERLKEVRRLEDQADALMDQAAIRQFEGVSDIQGMVAAIRWGELYQHLEDATDRAKDVAKALEEIALKHA